MPITVLILGNGFDLAHGLPTRYSDFLNFCNSIFEIENSIKSYVEYSIYEYQRIEYIIKKNKVFSEMLDKFYKILVRKEKTFQSMVITTLRNF